MNLAIVCAIGHYTGAIRSEAPRNGQTKPACGAGYQRCFSAKVRLCHGMLRQTLDWWLSLVALLGEPAGWTT